jgi:uncharacterized protein YggL (DUF469 family)
MKHLKNYKLFEAEQYDIETGNLINSLKGKETMYMLDGHIFKSKIKSGDVGDLDEYKLTSFVKTDTSSSATADKTGVKQEVLNIDFEDGRSLCFINNNSPTYRKHEHGGTVGDKEYQEKTEEWHWIKNLTLQKAVGDVINNLLQKLNIKVTGLYVDDSSINLKVDEHKKIREKNSNIIKKWLNQKLTEKFTNLRYDFDRLPLTKYSDYWINFDQGKMHLRCTGKNDVTIYFDSGHQIVLNDNEKTQLETNVKSMYKEMFNEEFNIKDCKIG